MIFVFLLAFQGVSHTDVVTTESIDYQRPTDDYAVMLDFDYQDHGVAAPVGNFTSDIQLDSDSKDVSFSYLSDAGIDAIGTYEVYALLVDTSKSLN